MAGIALILGVKEGDGVAEVLREGLLFINLNFCASQVVGKNLAHLRLKSESLKNLLSRK